MRWLEQNNPSDFPVCEEGGFTLALGNSEAGRQAWACAAVCAAILIAALVAVLSGTA